MHGAAIHPMAGVEGAGLCTARLHGWSLSLSLLAQRMTFCSCSAVERAPNKRLPPWQISSFSRAPLKPSSSYSLVSEPLTRNLIPLVRLFLVLILLSRMIFRQWFYCVSIKPLNLALSGCVHPNPPPPHTFPPIPLLYSTLCFFFHSSFADSLSWLVVLYNPVQVGYACTFLFFLLPPV